jgi:hypothetical protein
MTGDEKTFKDFENVDKFGKEVINPIFPHANFASSFMVSSPDELATDFNGKLSPINLFKDTDYEYKGDGKFIHYTSLFGIKAILETGYIRMSEFGNLIDKSELQYASEIFIDNPIFQIKKEKLEQLKENLFCLSMCESNDKTKRNSFLWEVYGDKGKGAVIEFELTKNNPKLFLLGKVQYGEERLQQLRELKKNAEKFKKDNNGFFPNNFIELLAEIQSFHKSKRYDAEKEVRLFLKTDKRQYEEHKLESIYKDINSNQEVKCFNKLYLKGKHPFLDFKYSLSDEEDAVFNEFPQVEIKSIIPGFNISVENKVAVTDLFNKIKAKHNYELEIFQINNEKEIIKMS